jgi:uncharacterized alkaline shock family protein YloU
VEGHASISTDVLARYAADAACEVEGVRGLVESHLHRHRGVRINGDGAAGGLTVELHLDVAWGASIPQLGSAVQRRVGDYLERMAGERPAAVDVVVDEIGPPS